MKEGNCQSYEEWSLRNSGVVVLDTLQLQNMLV
jgi:hypothetical protein